MKITSDKIREEFKNKAFISGNTFLLKPKDAISMIEKGVACGLEIAGVDGFFVIPPKIQPYQEHSKDAADTKLSAKEFEKEIIKFLSDKCRETFWFEVVFESDVLQQDD